MEEIKSNPKKEEEKSPLLRGIEELSDVIKEFIRSKYRHDKTAIYIHGGIVFVILLGIVSLKIWGELDSSIVGTLIGSLIGFAFGNFPKNNKGSGSGE